MVRTVRTDSPILALGLPSGASAASGDLNGLLTPFGGLDARPAPGRGGARAYQLVTSERVITPEQFGRLERLAVRLAPAPVGRAQRLRLPRSPRRYVTIRAVDQAGNLGRPLVLRVAW